MAGNRRDFLKMLSLAPVGLAVGVPSVAAGAVDPRKKPLPAFRSGDLEIVPYERGPKSAKGLVWGHGPNKRPSNPTQFWLMVPSEENVGHLLIMRGEMMDYFIDYVKALR